MDVLHPAMKEIVVLIDNHHQAAGIQAVTGQPVMPVG